LVESKLKLLKLSIAVHGKPISELRGVKEVGRGGRDWRKGREKEGIEFGPP